MRRSLALAVLMVLTACVAQGASTVPTRTPAASSEVSATPDESSAASASPTPTPATGPILPPDSVATVLVADLAIRDEPRNDGQVLATLHAGDRVAVSINPNILGPVSADGFDWYPIVSPVDWEPGSEIIGWIAAGTSDAPYVETDSPVCDGNDLDVAGIITGYGRLVCFGSADLVMEGTYGCGECGGLSPGTFEPGWLAHPIGDLHVLRDAAVSGTDGTMHTIAWLPFHVDPALGISTPAGGSIIRVVGHFDDPAATTCTISSGPPGEGIPADPRAAVLYCREQFTVRTIEVIGTDPNWPLGG
jgi:hypothetical protein